MITSVSKFLFAIVVLFLLLWIAMAVSEPINSSPLIQKLGGEYVQVYKHRTNRAFLRAKYKTIAAIKRSVQ